MSDYYEILGVTHDASQDEIGEAYCKKTRQLHPDHAGPESEGAFKELSIAYEALPDPEKHRLYDAGSAGALRGGASPFQGAGGFSDFLDTVFPGLSGVSSGLTPRRRRGTDQLIDVDTTLKEAALGTQKIVSFAAYIERETCRGSMCAEDIQSITCSDCGGSGTVTRISNMVFGQMQSRAAYGARGDYGMIISSPRRERAGQGRVRSCRSYPIDIPAGVTKDMRIRVPNKAEVSPSGGPQGDLYLEIRELTGEVFVRRGDDSHMWTTIPMITTAFDTGFMLSTFNGERTAAIPVGTQPDEKITLRELDVGRLQHPGRGNLHAHIEVEAPKKLDACSRKLLEELTALRKKRRVESQRHDHSMFEKLKGEFARQ